METGRRAPMLYRNIKPASKSMANSQFVNARNAMRLNMFLSIILLPKPVRNGGGGSPR
jgi:hypothetical protein